MCVTPTLDTVRQEGFTHRMIGLLNDAGLAMMISIGHRTGLFDKLAEMPPATCEDIAAATGLNARYVREWLGAMVTGEILTLDPQTGLYALPAEHAACLTRQALPNLAVVTQFVAVLGTVEDKIVDCFRHGGGVPYEHYPRFHEVMAEESAQSVGAAIVAEILPLAPGVSSALEQGIHVLDVGCGAGRTLNQMGARFPKSTFVGYDFSTEAIETAQRQAAAEGLTNVRFAVKDVSTLEERDAFDLICAFDSIHDQAQPAKVLGCIAQALTPGGTFLMQDIAGSCHHHANGDQPLAPFMYTISCMHCMTVSLADGGAGLGAMWGKETALQMLGDAGFQNVAVEKLEHDPLNYFYIAK